MSLSLSKVSGIAVGCGPLKRCKVPQAQRMRAVIYAVPFRASEAEAAGVWTASFWVWSADVGEDVLLALR